jgi:hypothetical protein
MPIDANIKLLYNPDSDSKLYMIPDLIPIILQVQVLLLSAVAIVASANRAPWSSLDRYAHPGLELMLGKMFPICWFPSSTQLP